MSLMPKICVGKDVENLEPKHLVWARKKTFKLYTHSFLLVLNTHLWLTTTLERSLHSPGAVVHSPPPYFPVSKQRIDKI